MFRKRSLLARTALLFAMTTVQVCNASPAIAGGASLHGVIKEEQIWPIYKQRFLKSDGRIIDNANGNVSHSEGQGFAMLMAIAADDQKAFERIWHFTRKTLGVRRDGLFAWRYRSVGPLKKVDRNNATDGDLLIAWALLEAERAGFGNGYDRQAHKILTGIRKLVVGDAMFGNFLLPAVYGFSPAHQKGRYVLNLSYWVFPALERISALTGDQIWNRLSASGRKLLSATSYNRAGLPADWFALRRNSGAVEFAPKFGTEFSYNAVRVPLYLAWSGKAAPNRLHNFRTHWIGRAGGLQRVNIRSNRAAGRFLEPGYHAVAAAVNCALDGQAFPASLRADPGKLYYPASLQVLSIIAVKQRYPECWK